MLNNNEFPNLKYEYSNTALLRAIKSQNTKIVKKILSFLYSYPEILKDTLTQNDKHDNNALLTAIKSQNTEIVKEILLSISSHPEILNAILTQRDRYGLTALSKLALSKNDEITKKTILSLSSSPIILREILSQKDEYGDTLLFRAIKSQNTEIVKAVLSSLSSHPEILKEILTQQDQIGYPILARAIISNNTEIVKEILSSLSSLPEILRVILTQEDHNGNTALLRAMISYNPEIIEEIISYISSSPEILKETISSPSLSIEIINKILSQKDEYGVAALSRAIISDNSEIVKEILSSLSSHPEILREILTQKDEYGDTAFSRAIISDNTEIVKETLSSLSSRPEIFKETILSITSLRVFKRILSFLSSRPEILREILTQEDEYGCNLLSNAIISNNPEIVKEILSSLSSHPEILREILTQKDHNEDPVFIHVVKNILINTDESKTNNIELFKMILNKMLKTEISDEQVSIMIDYVKNHILLSLMSSNCYYTYPNEVCYTIKQVASDDMFRGNEIAKIYRDDLVKIDENIVIKTHDNKDLYICKARVREHDSYLAFCVDSATQKLISISYCDGNCYKKLDDKIIDSTTFYGVRSYEISDDILFTDKFAEKFIEINFMNKEFCDFAFPFKREDGEYFKIGNITYSIPTRIQRRGNCGFKSINLLARFLFEQTTNKDHRKCYKKFKDDLRSYVINGLEQNYQLIKEKFGENFLELLEIKNNFTAASQTKFGKKNANNFRDALLRMEYELQSELESQGSTEPASPSSTRASSRSPSTDPVSPSSPPSSLIHRPSSTDLGRASCLGAFGNFRRVDSKVHPAAQI